MTKITKRTVFILLLILLLCLTLTACDKDKDSKETKTVEIKTVDDLKSINNYLGDKYSLYTFELKKNLDLTGQSWTPIGYDNTNSFRAKFFGNGYTISNLTIEGYDGYDFIRSIPYSYAGLFGYVYDATIKDLKLDNYKISYFAEKDCTHTGGLIGYAYGDNVITGIQAKGQIKMGATYTYVKKEVMQVNCNQTQYIGGIIGYSSGKLTMKDCSTDVDIENYIATRGPKLDNHTDEIVYEENSKGDKIPVMEIQTDLSEPTKYTVNSFAGSVAGYIKGNNAMFDNLQGIGEIPSLYSKSSYLGGLFGCVYNSYIVNSKFTGILGTRVFVKGAAGGIAGLIDETTITSSLVEDTEIKLNVTRSEYQSYTCGGLVGYANDFSVIQNSQVVDTKILSNLANKNYTTSVINYPVIGGFAGTIRDSNVLDNQAEGGGVFRTNYSDIDATYIFSAGMVSDVYGNSQVKRCSSSFKAYTGAIAKYYENVYVNEDGKRVLRYIKKDFPDIYVDIDAYKQDDKLVVDVIDENGDKVASYTYDEFTGSNIEEYSLNYFDENLGSLTDDEGILIVVDGRSLQGYERLTGMYTFEELDYKISSVIPESIGANDENISDGWNRFAI